VLEAPGAEEVSVVGGSIRERLAGLSRRELLTLAALAAVLAGGAGLWYVRSLPPPVELRATVPRQAGPTVAASPELLVVHVAGMVRRPGVYEFHDGDRVIDAIQAADGPRRQANLDALNLAAPLTDGEQVLVPGGNGPPGDVVAGEVLGGTTPALVNVNTASETELETLPGVGPVLGASIVAYRTENGPFPTVDALLDVSGIGPATLDKLRSLVTV
jgi:competence protein ComEA